MQAYFRFFWFVMPAAATLLALLLRNTRRVPYWTSGLVLSVVAAAPLWIGVLEPAPEPARNVSIEVATFFVTLPIVATFATERAWCALGRTHPVASAILGVPLGAVTYVVTVFVGVTFAVNLGLLEP